MVAGPRYELKEIPLDQLEPDPNQPRRLKDPGHVDRLAESIRAHGLLEPIVARPIGENRYRIIAGETRWRAAKQAGLVTAPTLIRNDDADPQLLALTENLARSDLRWGELAQALVMLFKERFELEDAELKRLASQIRARIKKKKPVEDLHPAAGPMVQLVRGLGLTPSTVFPTLVLVGLMPEATLRALDRLDPSLRDLIKLTQLPEDRLEQIHRIAARFGALDPRWLKSKPSRPPHPEDALFDDFERLKKAFVRFQRQSQEQTRVLNDPALAEEIEQLGKQIRSLEARLYRRQPSGAAGRSA